MKRTVIFSDKLIVPFLQCIGRYTETGAIVYSSDNIVQSLSELRIHPTYTSIRHFNWDARSDGTKLTVHPDMTESFKSINTKHTMS